MKNIEMDRCDIIGIEFLLMSTLKNNIFINSKNALYYETKKIFISNFNEDLDIILRDELHNNL